MHFFRSQSPSGGGTECATVKFFTEKGLLHHD
jgi:hypothetical protein